MKIKDLYNSRVLNSAILRYLCSFTKQGRKGHAKSSRYYLKKTSKEEGKFYPFIDQEKYARVMQIIKHFLHTLRVQNVISLFLLHLNTL